LAAGLARSLTAVTGTVTPRLPTMALLQLLQLLLSTGVASVSATMDPVDHAGLLRLLEAQPPAVRSGCSSLRGWDAHADPCDWPGVTCTGAASDTQRRVHVIDLRYCGLTTLPAEALVWEELIVLEVRGNAIPEIPATVSHLRSLQRIMIEMNRLTELPAQLCACGDLTNLYVAYNRLTAVPDCIGQLTKLGDIWLRGNNIATLPDSFCDLPLYSGYMMDAGLTALPECFGRIPFRGLELEGNSLTELPDSMKHLFSDGKLHTLVRHTRSAGVADVLASC
jgi:Leucine-rich repeat (LRR) protein